MKIKLREDKILDEISLGDAIVFENGDVRIIVRLPRGFGAYCPRKNTIFNEDSLTIKDLLKRYESSYKMVRVIKKDNLELTEI